MKKERKLVQEILRTSYDRFVVMTDQKYHWYQVVKKKHVNYWTTEFTGTGGDKFSHLHSSRDLEDCFRFIEEHINQ